MNKQVLRSFRAVHGAAALLLAGSACGSPTGFALVVQGFEPPAKYRVLWRTTERCAGVRRNFDAVQWFSTLGSADRDELGVTGTWYPDGNRIVLNTAYLDDEQRIRHEMLHAILRAGHRREFIDSCGGLVRCGTICAFESGGSPEAPTNASPVIQPEDLDVTVDVIEATPGESGWMAVIVTATNPRSTAVRVRLSGRPGVQFECRLDTALCLQRFTYPETYAPFAAGQSRREAMTFEASQGPHQIWGAFNTVIRGPVDIDVP